MKSRIPAKSATAVELRTLANQGRDAEIKIINEIRTAKTERPDVHRLLSHDHIREMLYKFSLYGIYFRQLREMKMSWIKNTMLKTAGGVSKI